MLVSSALHLLQLSFLCSCTLYKGIMQKIQMNRILLALLGSQERVLRWWDIPNKAFDLRTPNELWNNGEQETVKNYLLKQFDYSW